MLSRATCSLLRPLLPLRLAAAVPLNRFLSSFLSQVNSSSIPRLLLLLLQQRVSFVEAKGIFAGLPLCTGQHVYAALLSCKAMHARRSSVSSSLVPTIRGALSLPFSPAFVLRSLPCISCQTVVVQ